jgi:hypothetical protein
VLTTVKTWPGVAFLNMPVRPDIDMHAVREISRRVALKRLKADKTRFDRRS